MQTVDPGRAEPAEPKTNVRPRELPGPRGHFLLGSLPERRTDPLGLYTRAIRDYGDLVGFRMGPLRVVLVASPEGVKRVLVENQKNYPKGWAYEQLKPALGTGLLTSEGEFWRGQRRLVQPAFHRKEMPGLLAMMIEDTQALLKKWQTFARTGESFDLAREMNHLALSIVSRTLLGSDITGREDDVGGALSRMLEDANHRLLSVVRIPLAVPTPRNLKLKRALRVLDSVVLKMIAERRGQELDPSRKDILTLLMRQKDNGTGRGMTDQQLRDEVMTLFLAGHETTANLLAWTFALLDEHPESARRIREETQSLFGSGERALQLEDLEKLPYTRQVLEEVLRLYPPAWVVARQAMQDDVIGGYRIPARALIVVSPYVLHRNPRYWPNPDAFDPERFRPENAEKRGKFEFIPFSGGPRVCIGAQFAMMEATVVLASILARYEIQRDPSIPVVPEPLVTLRPKHGVWVRVRERG